MAQAAARRESEQPRAEPAPAPAVPLVVPAGALLRTEPRLELVLALARRRPAALLGWLAHGCPEPLPALAAAVGVRLDPALLPLDPARVAELRAARAAGRPVRIVDPREPALAQAIALRLGLPEGAVGEPEPGDPPAPFAAPARPRPRLATWARALRLHQWAKNLLVLVPVLLAGPLATAGDLARAGLAFLLLGCLASAGYLVNDLLDLEADRRHPSKRDRPLASGELALGAGLLAVPVLVALAGLGALLLPAAFALVAGAYLAITLAYSFSLKRVPLLDVLVLGGLFTLRVLTGAEVIAAPLSYWLLTFSMFLFLSLAMVKRYAELDRLAAAGGRDLADRGYSTADLPLLLATGLASGIAATLIFVVYLVAEQFPRAIYARPGWLWLVFPVLLLWLLRTWRLALHGRMDQDPVLFALTDRPSLAMGGAVLACLLLAW